MADVSIKSSEAATKLAEDEFEALYELHSLKFGEAQDKLIELGKKIKQVEEERDECQR